MAQIYALHDVSGQVAWVEESLLDHPVFGEHLIEVPYGTKPYNPELFSGNADRLRAKLAKELEKATKEGEATTEDLAAQLEQNEDAGAVVPDPIPAPPAPDADGDSDTKDSK